MKTFNEFCSQLDESSLSRIKSKSDKGGMAVISGSRGDKSKKENKARAKQLDKDCLLYTSPSPRDRQKSRMPSSA